MNTNTTSSSLLQSMQFRFLICRCRLHCDKIGFIGIHAQSVASLPSNRIQAFDGVTTALEAESGILPVGEWYKATEAEGRATNFGATVYPGTVYLIRSVLYQQF